MRNKGLIGVVLGSALLVLGLAASGARAQVKVTQTQRVDDIIVSLTNGSGQWVRGKNAFVVAFKSTKDKQPVDAGRVMFSPAPMAPTVTLSPDRTPGQYLGTIDLSEAGTRKVTVVWEGPAGKGAAKFSLLVR